MFEQSRRAVLSGLVLLGLIGTATMPISASASVADSAVTVAWDDGTRDSSSVFYDEFKNWNLTVSQTENLTNQGIRVSWSGLNPGIPAEFSRNFVQIMQCWGPASGPNPEFCQWGGSSASTANLLGSQAAGRDLSVDEDPAQAYDAAFLIPPPRNRPNQRAYRVPFRPSDATSADFNYTKYFDASSSNEITAAVVGADGTGQAVFEVQTVFEAPHLGCGADTPDGPASCWLVAVPRGSRLANGEQIEENTRVTGSPLSATNWAHRLQVRISFDKITAVCPIGNSERRLVGNDIAGAAVTAWQPALCKNSATFGFTQVGDTEARNLVQSSFEGVPGLALVSDPIDLEPDSEQIIYSSPALQSAIVIGFNIDRNLKNTASNFDKYGTLVEEITLNARLIAKLLTQSYRSDVPGGNEQEYVKQNPRSIATDPEFLELNPEFEGFSGGIEPEGLVVSLGASDAAAQIWQWLRTDVKAKAFLSGTADEWGMVINKYYLALELQNDLEIESFPKTDLSTYRPNLLTPEPGFGTLDLRPYVNDMQEAAIVVRRSDAKSKTVWDLNKVPPAFTSSGGQTIGQHFQFGVTTLAAAKRYGLGVAKLIDSNGDAIAPTNEAIQSAVSDMKVDQETGTLTFDAASLKAGSYPLATVTHAVVNPCTQNQEALEDYADFLNYAAGAGQDLGYLQGNLPLGFVPLTSAQQESLTALATKIVSTDARKNCPVVAEPEPSETPTELPIEEFPPIDYLPEPGSGGSAFEIAPNFFKTIVQTPGAANVFMMAAGILGVPGFLGGQLLVASARRQKNRGTPRLKL